MTVSKLVFIVASFILYEEILPCLVISQMIQLIRFCQQSFLIYSVLSLSLSLSPVPSSYILYGYIPTYFLPFPFSFLHSLSHFFHICPILTQCRCRMYFLYCIQITPLKFVRRDSNEENNLRRCTEILSSIKYLRSKRSD